MTNSEMIEKIVGRLGVTPAQAEEALQRNSWDLLDAMIYAERTYGQQNNANASHYTTYNANNANVGNNGNFGGFDERKSGFDRKSAREVFHNLFRKSLHNGIAVMYNGNEIATVPIIVCIILILSSCSSVLLVMLIWMFFNVSYRFKGNELGGSKLNEVLDGVYDFVQNLKKSILG